LQSNQVIYEIMTTQASLIDGMLTFFDPLFLGASFIVKLDHVL